MDFIKAAKLLFDDDDGWRTNWTPMGKASKYVCVFNLQWCLLVFCSSLLWSMIFGP